MRKILPFLLLLVGTGAGVGAGVYLRPSPQELTDQHPSEVDADLVRESSQNEQPVDGKEYIKLSNQFVVPIVEDDRIASMVVMTLSVETGEGQGQQVYDLEPKIRDVFLRVLFDHAAIGGFRGAFLNNDNLDTVRRNLINAAFKSFGEDIISDVLIFEIARQDY